MSDTSADAEEEATATKAAEAAAKELDENQQRMADATDPADLDAASSPLEDAAAAAVNDATSMDEVFTGPTLGGEAPERPTPDQSMISHDWGDQPHDWRNDDFAVAKDHVDMYDEVDGKWVYDTIYNEGVDKPDQLNKTREDHWHELETQHGPYNPKGDTASQENGLVDSTQMTAWAEATAEGLEEATGLDWTGDGTVAGVPPPPPPPPAEYVPPDIDGGGTGGRNPYAGQTDPQGDDDDPLTPDRGTVNPNPEAFVGGTDPYPTRTTGVSDPPDDDDETTGSGQEFERAPVLPGDEVINPSPDSEGEPGEQGDFIDPTEHQGTLDPSILDDDSGEGQYGYEAGDRGVSHAPSEPEEYEAEALVEVPEDPVEEEDPVEGAWRDEELEVADVSDFTSDIAAPVRGGRVADDDAG